MSSILLRFVSQTSQFTFTKTQFPSKIFYNFKKKIPLEKYQILSTNFTISNLYRVTNSGNKLHIFVTQMYIFVTQNLCEPSKTATDLSIHNPEVGSSNLPHATFEMKISPKRHLKKCLFLVRVTKPGNKLFTFWVFF
jgi:hypothetical protein